MIKVFYSFEDPWPAALLEQHLHFLPVAMQLKISSYRDKEEQQHRITSKLMLNRLIRECLPLTMYNLSDVKYTGYNKAYLNDAFHFSISYTNNLVVCAASVMGSIGIDVEKVVPVKAEILKDSFTLNEWKALSMEKSDPSLFYTFWTRKEAALKAIGKGIFENFNKIEILEKMVIYEDKPYYIQDLEINEQVRAALVSEKEEQYILERFSTT